MSPFTSCSVYHFVSLLARLANLHPLSWLLVIPHASELLGLSWETWDSDAIEATEPLHHRYSAALAGSCGAQSCHLATCCCVFGLLRETWSIGGSVSEMGFQHGRVILHVADTSTIWSSFRDSQSSEFGASLGHGVFQHRPYQQQKKKETYHTPLFLFCFFTRVSCFHFNVCGYIWHIFISAGNWLPF